MAMCVIPQCSWWHSLRRDYDSRISDVDVQIPGFLVLQRGGVVHLDLEAGAVDVKLLPIVGNTHGEARTAGDLSLLGDAVGSQIESPELAAFVPMHPVGHH